MQVSLLTYNARMGDAIGRQVLNKVRYFTNLGWDIRVFLESDAKLITELEPFTHLDTARGLWRDADARQYLLNSDMVVAEYGMTYGMLDLLPALVNKKPHIILDYYGVTPVDLAQEGHRRQLEADALGRSIVWCADFTLVHSRFTFDELRAATNYPADRIRMAPLSGAAIDARPVSRSAKPGIQQILFAGRLAANKRATMLVEAIGQLRERLPPIHAVFVGDKSDIYAHEAKKCLNLAGELGVSDRIQLLGSISEDSLHEWYRRADVLVIPSIHEGFCLPVIEAMAAGLPVVAARAGALPETVGDGALTCTPDDVTDLCEKITTALDTSSPAKIKTGRIAIVAPRYGLDFAGGAETSLRKMAHALQHSGMEVEIFTTCCRHESRWANELPAGTTTLDGLPVHRFPIDDFDPEQHLKTLDMIRNSHSVPGSAWDRTAREATPRLDEDYFQNSLNSTALITTFQDRINEFEAVIAGPYLFGLTWNVAKRFARQTILVPCFHPEPFAFLQSLPEIYSNCAGLLYHSPEEKAFAEAELGINHPNAIVAGTYLESNENPGDAARGRELVGKDYILYCGRYSREKGFHDVLAFAGEYLNEKETSLKFAFIGQNDADVPSHPNFLDLGFVPVEQKRDLIAGAAALVQLSRNESLSLVALEAWAAGVPVIAHRNCDTLREQIARCDGGRVVSDYQDFSDVLDDLVAHPSRWQQMGHSGQKHVQATFSSEEDFADRLKTVIDNSFVPLRDQMIHKGHERAARFTVDRWQEKFNSVVQEAIELDHPPFPIQLEIRPQVISKDISSDSPLSLIPVQVTNVGRSYVASRGPGRTVLRFRLTANDSAKGSRWQTVPLPRPLAPGESAICLIPANPREMKESCRLQLSFKSRGEPTVLPPVAEICLNIRSDTCPAGVTESFRTTIDQALAEAICLKHLPDDYQDISTGYLSGLKKQIKRTLLNNFRRLYVDEMSRQQSKFNEQMVLAAAQLNLCCEVLERAISEMDFSEQMENLNWRLTKLENELRGKRHDTNKRFH